MGSGEREKTSLSHPRKVQQQRPGGFLPVFLEDCRRRYGADVVEEKLRDFERMGGAIKKPMPWFEEGCANLLHEKNVAKFEEDWAREKQEFSDSIKRLEGKLPSIELGEPPKKILRLSREVLLELSKKLDAKDLVNHLLEIGYERSNILSELKRLA